MLDSNKVDYSKIFKEIKENRCKLDACPGHRFDVSSFDLAPFSRQKAVCTVCGGEMPRLEACQYARGYAAAGGDPNEVIPGFMQPVELSLRDAAANIVYNAVIGPDASMKDSTDCFHVPTDDIDALRRLLFPERKGEFFKGVKVSDFEPQD